ncbi:hypothetical protein BD408DRAFT_412286 [Parasitella parasitica]|nr:hypothetical protein BD408DRAFT_412286 [Parasitella parasitica]
MNPFSERFIRRGISIKWFTILYNSIRTASKHFTIYGTLMITINIFCTVIKKGRLMGDDETSKDRNADS